RGGWWSCRAAASGSRALRARGAAFTSPCHSARRPRSRPSPGRPRANRECAAEPSPAPALAGREDAGQMETPCTATVQGGFVRRGLIGGGRLRSGGLLVHARAPGREAVLEPLDQGGEQDAG